MRETDIRHEAIHRTPHLPGGVVSYTADPQGQTIAGKLTFKLDMEPPAPRGHLLTALHAERPDQPETMRGCLDDAAAEQLRQTLDSDTTYRANEGKLTATTTVWIPTAQAELPSYYSAAPYLSGPELQPLSPGQEAALPELTRVIGKVLPPELHPHAEDIVHLAAQRLPNHQDVLRSYQRTSVPAVLAAYDHANEPTSRIEYSDYRPAATPNREHIYLQLRIDREPNPENRARLEAADDRLLGPSHLVSESANEVATKHLHELARTNAHIVEDGFGLGIGIDIPPTPGHTTTSSDAQPRPPLTAEQKTLFPELVETIDAILPPHHRQHTQTLALMAAAEVPSTADAITATDRVTLAEVIDHHEQKMESYFMAHPPTSMRTTVASFPQHPSTALHHQPTSTASPAAASTAQPARTATLDR
jgi:hypothetical protein